MTPVCRVVHHLSPWVTTFTCIARLQNDQSDGAEIDADSSLSLWRAILGARIGIQLGRKLSQKMICRRSVVNSRVKVNKFYKFVHVLSAICYHLLSSWIPILYLIIAYLYSQVPHDIYISVADPFSRLEVADDNKDKMLRIKQYFWFALS